MVVVVWNKKYSFISLISLFSIAVEPCCEVWDYYKQINWLFFMRV